MQNKTDEIIREIADYVLNSKIESDEAFKISRGWQVRLDEYSGPHK